MDAAFRKHGGAQGGFSLVEILVVAAVVAVGLLGGEALVVTSLEASRSAMLQTIAVDLAADLGDRIRANPSAGSAYGLSAGARLGPPPKACRTVGECNSADLAAVDLYLWQQATFTALPEATTVVQVEPAGGATHRYTIVLRWTATGRPAESRVAATVEI
ncbi:MAG TPA: type IV pilus modification protein PilV [Steroidobacteraceae bacterium]|nr:type IV pilus modification protein PilV [Steroidobacteraceae bacterium]